MADSGAAGANAAAVPAEVELVRLDRPSARVADLRSAVLKLRLAPGQQRFSGEATTTLPRADVDPNRFPFAVLWRGTAVGFGIIDLVGCLAEITDDPEHAVLLRAFYIDTGWQGKGLGRAACRALDPLVRDIAPAARQVLLTVNDPNPRALRAYLAGGFEYTGRRYLGIEARPQMVLRRVVH
ncbi:GNAT family N-acetyltransferase [Marinitenerispora sediminis]|uniref:GNAT family N-acetyltransferase n=1 Tax=Marinitenerispora sediminis TaxID=1931232 RepID=A0A368SZH6_9ACTN|nr:GNAT family N-acetyltransferase [Marinitenerispora sediminis]RCV48068.1 GNAT family N-acetyltransferase [Marinitenerispora sediminis]RCV51425.1 GNAT family N-acetyltransferase [Marinitenerispora sediminis]RCV57696.1 GNAT family N-acetyltransferase [Marinitenerispora sediminis]